MKYSSRRDFLKIATLALAGARCGQESSSQPPAQTVKPLGVQLYTLRNQIDSDAESALRAIRDIGYRKVEVLSGHLDRIAPFLREFELEAVSGHFPAQPVMAIASDDAASADRFRRDLETAQSAGLQSIVIPYLPAEVRTSADFYRRFIDQMNHAGEYCRDAGVNLAYHHHAFEFEELDGVIPFELMVSGFDTNLVKWEVDVFWLALAGSDPVQMLKRLSGNVPLIHLKDASREVEAARGEVPPEMFTSVGSGRLDFPAILEAASSGGVQHLFVEQDHTPGDPVESLRQSYQYLRSIGV